MNEDMLVSASLTTSEKENDIRDMRETWTNHIDLPLTPHWHVLRSHTHYLTPQTTPSTNPDNYTFELTNLTKTRFLNQKEKVSGFSIRVRDIETVIMPTVHICILH